MLPLHYGAGLFVAAGACAAGALNVPGGCCPGPAGAAACGPAAPLPGADTGALLYCFGSVEGRKELGWPSLSASMTSNASRQFETEAGLCSRW